MNFKGKCSNVNKRQAEYPPFLCKGDGQKRILSLSISPAPEVMISLTELTIWIKGKLLRELSAALFLTSDKSSSLQEDVPGLGLLNSFHLARGRAVREPAPAP